MKKSTVENYCPAEDMEALMREEGRKLFTLETFTPVDELDIVGFTLQCAVIHKCAEYFEDPVRHAAA